MNVIKIEEFLIDFFENAKAIYIFGSFITSYFNENSDIDIAVLYKHKLNFIELIKKKEELEFILKRDVDLIDLQQVDDVFAYEIINNSKKIKDSLFARDYELRVWYRYLDLQEDRKIILEDRYG